MTEIFSSWIFPLQIEGIPCSKNRKKTICLKCICVIPYLRQMFSMEIHSRSPKSVTDMSTCHLLSQQSWQKKKKTYSFLIKTQQGDLDSVSETRRGNSGYISLSRIWEIVLKSFEKPDIINASTMDPISYFGRSSQPSACVIEKEDFKYISFWLNQNHSNV